MYKKAKTRVRGLGWKEEGMRSCQNHPGRDRGNLREEESGSEKHREQVIRGNKAQLPNVKITEVVQHAHAGVLCRDKYKVRKEEHVAMSSAFEFSLLMSQSALDPALLSS